MFECFRKKKEEVVESQYRYDAEVRFNDGHIWTVKDAIYTAHIGRTGWFYAEDGDVQKYINTNLAEEVTITRRIVDA